MHCTRVITSLIGLVILIALIALGNLLVFWLLVSSVIVVGLWEFYRLAAARELPHYQLPGILLGWLLSLAPLFAASLPGVLTEFTFTLIVLALLLYALLTKRPLAESLPALALTLSPILLLSGCAYEGWAVFYITERKVSRRLHSSTTAGIIAICVCMS